MSPKVSVIMITYNHEKYIEEAIRSVFSQKTDFIVELLIANDSSPDDSDKIITNLISESPANIIVKYIRHEKNVGMNANFLQTLKLCAGEYISICEGDDYWQENLKLQKQVDFLDKNPSFSMYFHKSEDIKNKIRQDIETKEYTDIEILNNWYIHTASIMMRNDFTEEDYAILASEKVHFYDLFLFLIAANKGRVWGTGENMSFYRFIDSSITNTDRKISYYESLFNHQLLLSSIFLKKYKTKNKHRIKDISYKIFRYYCLKGNPKALKYFYHYQTN